MGEGGAITTNDAALAKHMCARSPHGMSREPGDFIQTAEPSSRRRTQSWYYEMNAPGLNYRVPDILCARA